MLTDLSRVVPPVDGRQSPHASAVQRGVGRLLRAHVRKGDRVHVVSYASGRLLVLSFAKVTEADIDRLTFTAEQRAAQFG